MPEQGKKVQIPSRAPEWAVGLGRTRFAGNPLPRSSPDGALWDRAAGSALAPDAALPLAPARLALRAVTRLCLLAPPADWLLCFQGFSCERTRAQTPPRLITFVRPRVVTHQNRELRT